MTRSKSTLPVSGSTVTSTSSPANEGPTCVGFELAEATKGPPVLFIFAATSLKVSRSSGSFLEMKTPSA